MTVITTARDYSGTSIEKGDTVVTLNGQSTAKVCGLAREDDTEFVCLRPAHQSYGKGMWYAADQVYWVARPGSTKKDDKPRKGTLWTRKEPAAKK